MRFLSRARWDGRAVARRLLLYIIERLVPNGDVVVGVDDTIERRWGARVSTRAASIVIRSDPPRDTSSKPAACAGCR